MDCDNPQHCRQTGKMKTVLYYLVYSFSRMCLHSCWQSTTAYIIVIDKKYYYKIIHSFISSSFSLCRGWGAARNFFTASSDSLFHPPLSLVFFFQSSSSPAFRTSLLTQSSHLSLGLPRLLLPCSRNSAALFGSLSFTRPMVKSSSVLDKQGVQRKKTLSCWYIVCHLMLPVSGCGGQICQWVPDKKRLPERERTSRLWHTGGNWR